MSLINDFTGNAAPPAGSRFSEGTGVARTTGAGVATGGAAGASANAADGQQWDHQAGAPTEPPPAAAAAAVPFYKKRWFIISQIILIPLSIALLFIILFPVVRALVQLIVKKSTLDVQVANISAPQNGS